MTSSFSEPTLLFWYLSQPKSHSLSPPSATAEQYTVRFRSTFTLNLEMTCCALNCNPPINYLYTNGTYGLLLSGLVSSIHSLNLDLAFSMHSVMPILHAHLTASPRKRISMWLSVSPLCSNPILSKSG